MKTKFRISMATLLTLTTTVACSQATAPTPSAVPAPAVVGKPPVRFGQTVPGSYIVKAPGDGAAAIRRIFAEYGVALVNSIGNEQFELRLERDPGLEALRKLTDGSNGAVTAIQPNYIYHVY